MQKKDENNPEKDLNYSSDKFVTIDLNKPEIEKIKIIKKAEIAFKKDDIIA